MFSGQKNTGKHGVFRLFERRSRESPAPALFFMPNPRKMALTFWQRTTGHVTRYSWRWKDSNPFSPNLTSPESCAILLLRSVHDRMKTKYPIRVARGTSPMTARQPPGEKGGNACTIGLYRPHKSRLVFLHLFFGSG